jgi:Protein of unknown function (DUF3156)
MIRGLCQRLFNQPPPGFRPGATLGRVLAELQGKLSVTTADTASAVLSTADGKLSCEAREIIERHFLMHIVGLEFMLHVPAIAVPGARVQVRHTGMLFRTGIAYAAASKHGAALKAVTERLKGDGAMEKILMGLDFRRCELLGSEDGWTVRIEPYGASEVVNRMPSFRRYIRLGREQANALVMALNAFRRVLGEPAAST